MPICTKRTATKDTKLGVYVVNKGQVTNRFCTGLYGIISTAIWETLNLNRILVPHSVLKMHSIYEIIAMAQKFLDCAWVTLLPKKLLQ